MLAASGLRAAHLGAASRRVPLTILALKSAPLVRRASAMSSMKENLSEVVEDALVWTSQHGLVRGSESITRQCGLYHALKSAHTLCQSKTEALYFCLHAKWRALSALYLHDEYAPNRRFHVFLLPLCN
jgi:hypothetical protein